MSIGSSSGTTPLQVSRSLFASTDVNLWKQALNSYPTAVGKRASMKSKDSSNEELVRMDEWVHSTNGGYKKAVLSDNNGILDRQLLAQVVKWKLSRGTFRPGLLQKAESNSDALIRKTWQEAVARLNVPDMKNSDDALSTRSCLKHLADSLQGIGPATASALFAPIYPKLFAFYSDESVLATVTSDVYRDKGQIKYDLKRYCEYNEVVKRKAEELAGTWSAQDVQRALWAAGVLGAEAFKGSGPSSPTNTRTQVKKVSGSPVRAVPSMKKSLLMKNSPNKSASMKTVKKK